MSAYSAPAFRAKGALVWGGEGHTVSAANTGGAGRGCTA